MTHRSPIAVFFLVPITLGIYSLVWLVKTKEEMNQRGAEIPTAWFLIVPILNLVWIWKYSQGVARVTSDAMSAGLTFIVLLLTGNVGMALVQGAFNKRQLAAATVSPAMAA
jgi:hypothetical protein